MSFSVPPNPRVGLLNFLFMDKETNLNLLFRLVEMSSREGGKPRETSTWILRYQLPGGILPYTWPPNVKAAYSHKFRVTFSKPSCVVI